METKRKALNVPLQWHPKLVTALLLSFFCSGVVSFVNPTRTGAARSRSTFITNHVRSPMLIMSIAPAKNRFWSVFKRNKHDDTKQGNSRASVKLQVTVTKETPAQSIQEEKKPRTGKLNAFFARINPVKIVQGGQAKTQGPPAIELRKQHQEPTLVLIPAPLQQDLSAFESFKESLYDSVDSLSNLMTSSAAETSPTEGATVSKPLLKPSIVALIEVKQAKEPVPDLASTNLLKRALAELAIGNRNAQRIVEPNKEGPFSSFKNGFYGLVDFLETFVQVVTTIPERVMEAADAAKVAAMASYKWAASVPLALEESVAFVTSLPMEVEKKVKETQQSFDDTVQVTQQSIDATVQATQLFIEEFQAIPETVQKSVTAVQNSVDGTRARVASMSDVFEEAAAFVTSFPTKVETSVQETQQSIEDAVQATQLFVEEVQAIPETVQNSVIVAQNSIDQTLTKVASVPVVLEESVAFVTALPMEAEKRVKETQQSIVNTVQATQQSVEATVQATQLFVEEVQAIPETLQKSVTAVQNSLDETLTTIKVLVGTEERKPVPPKVPPPFLEPVPVSNMVWNMAAATASVSAKAAWSVGTGAIQLAWKGTQFAFSSLSKAKAVSSVAVPNPPLKMEIKDVSVDLDKEISAALELADAALMGTTKALDLEVMDALRLAEVALQKANDGPSYSNSGIDASLRLAKEAALRATIDVASMEKTLKNSTLTP